MLGCSLSNTARTPALLEQPREEGIQEQVCYAQQDRYNQALRSGNK